MPAINAERERMTAPLGQSIVRYSSYPHTSEWDQLFAQEAERIRTACTGMILGIEHVGSTAIPGILAKPIIDISVGVESLAMADDMAGPMASIGYDYPGDVGIPHERIFGRDRTKRTFLVHVVVFGGAAWLNHLRFRERCRADRRLASEYSHLKHQLAAIYPEDRPTYTQLKSVFVERVLRDDMQ